MRNVEAFDPLRQFRQAEHFLQFFANLLRIRFEHAKPLIVRLLGVVSRQVDERPLVPPLRHKDMHPSGTGTFARVLLGEQVLERFTILKIDGHIQVPRHIRLSDIKLLQQRREEFPGMKVSTI